MHVSPVPWHGPLLHCAGQPLCGWVQSLTWAALPLAPDPSPGGGLEGGAALRGRHRTAHRG